MPTARKILLVDDIASNLRILGLTLERANLAVVEARSGPEAISICTAELPSLVLLDLRMPEMDGQAFYEEIQRDYPQVLKRIVFVTAQAHSSDYGPFLRSTGIPVIEKPFTLSQLRQMVSKMVGPTR